ncbi:PASTA domain-containing protein [Desertivirga arenae]|uniref:PASTA domain-containing protein n=1 Tax=Desertivirga arenae TaxID=2810309 RepID=UPI001A976B4C|nr:PASTA domain-containing protein [Pedobacter sp. SYSU D00823]
MNKFLAYLRTDTFRKNLIIAIVSIIVFLLVIFFSLRFYTRHGEGQPVPKLKGMQVDEAIELLESQGFNYQVDSVFQVGKAPGLVIEQDPDVNTNVKANRTIYLTVITKNAPEVGFPNIFEMTFLEARAVLSNYGIKIGDTSYTSDIVRDRVLEASLKGRSISAGQQVAKGSVISLVLGDGKGASEVDLPDLAGSTLSEATFALKGSSLGVGMVTYEGEISDTTGARVIRQYPSVDSLSKVSIGSKVDLILSNGTPVK